MVVEIEVVVGCSSGQLERLGALESRVDRIGMKDLHDLLEEELDVN